MTITNNEISNGNYTPKQILNQLCFLIKTTNWRKITVVHCPRDNIPEKKALYLAFSQRTSI
jgi:hypothetical protein